MNINQLTPKKSKIEDDFIITSKVLGEGVNGKVLACIHRKTREKFALKVNYFFLNKILALNYSNLND